MLRQCEASVDRPTCSSSGWGEPDDISALRSCVASSDVAIEVSSPITAVYRVFATWMERHEQRAHLAEMDSRMLNDMGLDKVDALNEAAKPFWRA